MVDERNKKKKTVTIDPLNIQNTKFDLEGSIGTFHDKWTDDKKKWTLIKLSSLCHNYRELYKFFYLLSLYQSGSKRATLPDIFTSTFGFNTFRYNYYLSLLILVNHCYNVVFIITTL